MQGRNPHGLLQALPVGRVEKPGQSIHHTLGRMEKAQYTRR